MGSPLQTQNSVSPETRSTRADNSSKSNALLNSVVESIQSPRNLSQSLENHEGTPQVSPSDAEFSNSSRRNKDLADVLFGTQDLKGPQPQLSSPDARTTLH